jgi:hypothetical protein
MMDLCSFLELMIRSPAYMHWRDIGMQEWLAEPNLLLDFLFTLAQSVTMQ